MVFKNMRIQLFIITSIVAKFWILRHLNVIYMHIHAVTFAPFYFVKAKPTCHESNDILERYFLVVR